MIGSIEEYLEQLKTEMQGSDAATVQDALADAEEHLRAALGGLKEDQPALSDQAALDQVIDQYGTPAETAAAYAEVERRTVPQWSRSIPTHAATLGGFVGVYTAPHAWGALLYMLIAVVTGIFYFSWAVTGIPLSASFALFLCGLRF